MIRVTDRQYWMHPTLKNSLDTLAYNTMDDYSFMIIISGDAKVRVGKSMLGQQIAYYLCHVLKRQFSFDNLVFTGKELIDRSRKMKSMVYIMDESRADLGSAKTLYRNTQMLIDFFNETGKLNNIVILILPDFFDLTKSLAVGFSQCLINCFINKTQTTTFNKSTVQKFRRGYFSFYGESAKRILYDKGKKEYHNYGAVKWDYWGNFHKHWILDEEKYNKLKDQYIHRRRDMEAKGAGIQEMRAMEHRDALIVYMVKDLSYTQKQVHAVIEEYGGKCTSRMIGKAIEAYDAREKMKKKLE